MKRLYGLIGYPLTHSFSKKYFEDKFRQLNIKDCTYRLFEIKVIEALELIIQDNANLAGLNVTIPFKEQVLPYLDSLDESALKVGAVNVIQFEGDRRIGYNSDYYGFEKSLFPWIHEDKNNLTALVLGTGGAAKAVTAVLQSHNINFILVSRNKSANAITYDDLMNSSRVATSKLIINTTPLGMHPHINAYPEIPYQDIGHNHYVYDLIYNPSETLFLKKAKEAGAAVKNGQEMLILQAEKAWEIWSS